jgi:hypothetical protein
MSNITNLLQSEKTVFTFQEVKDILSISTDAGVKSFLQRAKKSGSLLNPRKGVRTLPVYNMNELAGALFPDGYISLEPVLFDAGVSFQFYGTTAQCVRHKNADIIFNNQNYTAKVIKKSIRDNPLCIQEFDGYRKAMPERALCDLVYLRPTAEFDNPQYFQNPQSASRLQRLLPLYPLTTQKHVRKLIAQQI